MAQQLPVSGGIGCLAVAVGIARACYSVRLFDYRQRGRVGPAGGTNPDPVGRLILLSK